ncbi:hypothetical protein [Sphingomonas oligophenolica]|uniref:Uncharacterized protein n=1 Tax=Sphingomonas oligophenolica TaxID=301154 RepID=A0A502CH92_9SPHN|nr:hypothetical protein [Sphingomonas oligophenolica]TPG12173.1 hypothetical protein EAH84_10570 [Sphingomonas oligophenolica]
MPITEPFADGHPDTDPERQHPKNAFDSDRGRDIPPDNGQRAWFDPKTGEVHGSGVGAGGGESGEDFDSDTASGDGAEHPSG